MRSCLRFGADRPFQLPDSAFLPPDSAELSPQGKLVGDLIADLGRCMVLAVETHPKLSISIWDVDRTACKRNRMCTGQDVTCGRWAPAALADFDAQQAVVAAQDRSLQLYDLRFLKPLAASEPGIFGNSQAMLQGTDFGKKHALAACSDRSGTMRTFDLHNVSNGTLRNHACLHGHLEQVVWGSFDWTDRTVRGATLSADGQLSTWIFERPGIVKPNFAQSAAEYMNASQANVGEPDGYAHVATLSDGTSAAAIDDADVADGAETGNQASWLQVPECDQVAVQKLPGKPNRVRAAAFQVVRKVGSTFCILAAGNKDGAVHLYGTTVGEDYSGGQEAFTGHTDQISTMSMDPDATRMVTGSLDRTIRLWSVQRSGIVTCEQTLDGHPTSVRTLAADWSAERALSGGTENQLCVWNLGNASMRNSASLLGHIALPERSAGPTEVLASFRLGRAAVLTREGQLCFIDLQRQAVYARLQSHPNSALAMQIGSHALSKPDSPSRSREPSPQPTRKTNYVLPASVEVPKPKSPGPKHGRVYSRGDSGYSRNQW